MSRLWLFIRRMYYLPRRRYYLWKHKGVVNRSILKAAENLSNAIDREILAELASGNTPEARRKFRYNSMMINKAIDTRDALRQRS